MQNLQKLQLLQKKISSISLDFPSLTAERVQEICEISLELFKTTYDYIAALNVSSDTINFKTAIQPMIDLEILNGIAYTLCSFPGLVHTEKKVRDACQNAKKAIDAIRIEMSLRQDAFQLFLHYQNVIYTKESETLHWEENRYFRDLMRTYKRNGLFISNDAVQHEINYLKKQISILSLQFSKNLNDENQRFEFTEEELKGLPNDFLLSRKNETNKYIITLKYPDVFPILDYAENRDIRRKIYIAFNARVPENIDNLKKLALYRAKLAKLLGYETHLDYTTEIRMMKNAENVMSFLKDMLHTFNPFYEKELEHLKQLAKKLEKNKNFTLEQYDLPFYKRIDKEQTLHFDMEAIKYYFPVNDIITKVLNLYSTIFGLKFVENETPNKWHASVRVIDVYDNTYIEDTKIGRFYLDLFPREGKFSHAAAFDLIAECDISHIQLEEKQEPRRLSQAAMVCNFPMDFLSFEDVITFFHELGHILHNMCARTKLPKYYAYGVEWDFVEVPSQLLEYWCHLPKVLSLISSLDKTGKPLPLEMAEQLAKASFMHRGLFVMRLLSLSYFDCLIHSMSEESIQSLDINQFFIETYSQMTQLPPLYETFFPATFGHLAGGYDGGYYSYLLDRMYAADIFKNGFAHDPLSSEIGKKYRQTILEPGGSQDAIELLKQFLGRTPRMDAFLEESGVV